MRLREPFLVLLHIFTLFPPRLRPLPHQTFSRFAGFRQFVRLSESEKERMDKANVIMPPKAIFELFLIYFYVDMFVITRNALLDESTHSPSFSLRIFISYFGHDFSGTRRIPHVLHLLEFSLIYR